MRGDLTTMASSCAPALLASMPMEILYSGERFAAGGAQTVRGYRETLVLADTGATASVELARTFSLSGPNGGRSSFDLGRFSASVFADGAILGNREGPPATPNDIASVGVGLSWVPSRAIEARVDICRGLDRRAADRKS